MTFCAVGLPNYPDSFSIPKSISEGVAIYVLLLRFPNSSKIGIEANRQRAGVESDRSSRCQGAGGLNLAGSFFKQLVKGTSEESKYSLM